ncbi:vegetative cell wall protein gp1-like [Raphanus sativus]|uniref:Vegetative cell wall protein gp1-like n=1 Tax=Raphanus sativus TaxID=3726 RepID=A0A6J0LWU1_RAPSA|nr:vegetative cell wall protein gp1-like [Raphanus sativus]KAJ4910465.1 vegetative cell wall protein gp1-like [Raphanus sativus]
MRNCPKGPRGLQDWIQVSHKKNNPSPHQSPPDPAGPSNPISPSPPLPSSPLAPPAPPSPSATPPQPESQIICDSPVSEAPNSMDIDTSPASKGEGNFIIGLEAVHRDRPITVVSNKFAALSSDQNHTALNPFVLPPSNPLPPPTLAQSETQTPTNSSSLPTTPNIQPVDLPPILPKPLNPSITTVTSCSSPLEEAPLH